MITIDQLLESVDLEFEPRFVTKDMNGYIQIWHAKPRIIADGCWGNSGWRRGVSILKLSEFAGKDWTQCIYEVPRKTDKQNLEKLRPADSDLVYRVNLPRKTTGKIEKLNEHAGNMQLSSASMTRNQFVANTIMKKINELVDTVNELKKNKGM